jgi:hypothetical protein
VSYPHTVNLPSGCWFTFGGLRGGTTPEEIQAALLDAYIELPLDRISISKPTPFGDVTAIISMPREQTRLLLNRALLETQVRGVDLIPRIPASQRDK